MMNALRQLIGITDEEKQERAIAFGERLNLVRRTHQGRGISRKDLAEKLGIPMHHITELEAGKKTCWWEYIPELAKALEVDEDMLLLGTQEELRKSTQRSACTTEAETLLYHISLEVEGCDPYYVERAIRTHRETEEQVKDKYLPMKLVSLSSTQRSNQNFRAQRPLPLEAYFLLHLLAHHLPRHEEANG